MEWYGSLTGSFLSESVRQPLLQSVDVLLSTPQLRLLLVTPQLQARSLKKQNKMT